MEGRREGTFVGGKGGGWVGGDPLVPGLRGPNLGVTGLTIADINEVKKRIKEKFEGKRGYAVGRIDVMAEGLMLGNTGFAKAMRNVVYGLDRHGCNIRTLILDKDNVDSKGTTAGNRVIALKSGGVISDGGSFYMTMNIPLGVRNHPGFYNLAYIMFETADFPQAFVSHFKNARMDEVWTPSSFCRDTMVRAGLGDVLQNKGGIYVMPLGVDTVMFSKERADWPRCIPGNLGGPLEGKFKFLTVMGYSERKGVSILIKAFVEEFGLGNRGLDAGKVALYLKGGSYSIERAINEIEKMISDIPGINNNNRPYIHIDFATYSDDVLASLYKACDAFVLPSRGEGFGLPYCEAMSMALPTIGTRWGGNLEFMDDDNSYLIDVSGFAEEPRCEWITGYYKGHKFAVPSVGHLRQLMRHVFEHREEAIEKGKKARKHIEENFDWSVSCARMKNRLEEIARG